MFIITPISATQYWALPHLKTKIKVCIHSTTIIRLYNHGNNLGFLMLEHYVNSRCHWRLLWGDDFYGVALYDALYDELYDALEMTFYLKISS